jgi:hypothetical protein
MKQNLILECHDIERSSMVAMEECRNSRGGRDHRPSSEPTYCEPCVRDLPCVQKGGFSNLRVSKLCITTHTLSLTALLPRISLTTSGTGSTCRSTNGSFGGRTNGHSHRSTHCSSHGSSHWAAHGDGSRSGSGTIVVIVVVFLVW